MPGRVISKTNILTNLPPQNASTLFNILHLGTALIIKEFLLGFYLFIQTFF